MYIFDSLVLAFLAKNHPSSPPTKTPTPMTKVTLTAPQRTAHQAGLISSQTVTDNQTPRRQALISHHSYHQSFIPYHTNANMEARGINDPPGPDAWFRNLPIVTRFWLGGSMVVTLGVNFGIISGYLIPFAWENVKSKFELWRLLSCFLYVGPVSVSDSAVVALSVCLFPLSAQLFKLTSIRTTHSSALGPSYLFYCSINLVNATKGEVLSIPVPAVALPTTSYVVLCRANYVTRMYGCTYVLTIHTNDRPSLAIFLLLDSL